MTDKVQKIREEVEIVVNRRLNLLNGDYFDLNKEVDGFTNEIMDIIDSLKEEPVSEDLEKAIDTYLATYWGGEKEKQDWPFLKKMAIHFANWQKKQDQETIELAEDHAMLAGMNKMKQQMMAKAIDAKCFGFQGAALFSFKLPADNYLVGSEVKVIVIKED